MLEKNPDLSVRSDYDIGKLRLGIPCVTEWEGRDIESIKKLAREDKPVPADYF